MQLPQISCFGWHSGAFVQSGSAQSTRPSPSLSMPSLHCSGPQPGTSVWPQAPPVQLSVVQALPSSQSTAVSHRWQPAMAESWQLPSVPQASSSLPPAAVVDGPQPEVVGWAQAPASQLSVVQALPSLQSAAVVQGTQPEIVACAQAPALHVSVVQALPSPQSAAVVHGT